MPFVLCNLSGRQKFLSYDSTPFRRDFGGLLTYKNSFSNLLSFLNHPEEPSSLTNAQKYYNRVNHLLSFFLRFFAHPIPD